MAFRWWCLRGEIEARRGGDVVTSLTTSNEEIAPQSPPARRVACAAPPSVSRALLSDVTASPASRPLTSDGAAHATKGHVFRTHYTSALLAAVALLLVQQASAGTWLTSLNAAQKS